MTRPRKMYWGAAIVLAALVPIVLGWGGVYRWLGAHPWWDLKTALIGAPIGIALALVLRLVPRAARLAVALLVIGIAYYLAYSGKVLFAESFAEDVSAGKKWYFGWIGISAGLSALALTLLAPPRQ